MRKENPKNINKKLRNLGHPEVSGFHFKYSDTKKTEAGCHATVILDRLYQVLCVRYNSSKIHQNKIHIKHFMRCWEQIAILLSCFLREQPSEEPSRNNTNKYPTAFFRATVKLNFQKVSSKILK